MSVDALNEQQRAELEAVALRFGQLTADYSSLQTTIGGLQDAINHQVVFLNTLAQNDPSATSQTLYGNYYFGTSTDPSLSGTTLNPLQEAHVTFGPTSSLKVLCIPKESYDAVPKAYVDNIVSPLYTQISRALSIKNAIFITFHKNGAATDLALTVGDLISNSTDYVSVFTLGSQQVTFLLGGTYQFSWNLASPVFTALMTPVLQLDGIEIGRMYLSSAACGTINVTMTVNNGSILSWSSASTPFTNISNTLSIVRLGD